VLQREFEEARLRPARRVLVSKESQLVKFALNTSKNDQAAAAEE
jgi:hypothetical protein